MAGEWVPSLLLQAGDVIHVRHCHDLNCGECLSDWEIDAVVTEDPAPVGDRVAVSWANGARLPGQVPTVTGINLLAPGEQVLRIGRVANLTSGACT
jgi:hypothetical protein